MRILLRGVFLTCLLVPPAAHGQKRIVLPGINLGVAKSFGQYDPPEEACDFIFCRGGPGGVLTSETQLSIFNPEDKLGYHRVSFIISGPSLLTLRTLTYGGGIASSGRYHFASLSVGPALVFNEEGPLDWL